MKKPSLLGRTLISQVKDLEEAMVDLYTEVVSIPRPVKGDKGDSIKGDKGDDGLSAYQIWLENGNSGTEKQFLKSLRGRDGEKIIQTIIREIEVKGLDGVSITNVELNSKNQIVTTLSSGKVIHTNALPTPKDGRSAYEIWLGQGNEGTESDFLRSLKGRDGEAVHTYSSGAAYNSARLTPTGGTQDQVLQKNSDVNNDTRWGDVSTLVDNYLVGGDGITYNTGTISADINTINLKFTAGKINTIQDIATTSSPTFANLTITDQIINRNLQASLSCGVHEGMEVSINADPTKIDIAAGTYTIVDCWTDPQAPVEYNITYAGATGITVTNLATANFSYILIDKDQAIIQLTEAPTQAQHRNTVTLAQIGHTNRVSVVSVNPSVEVFAAPVEQLRDYWNFFAIANKGNIISANGANLSINKSIGYLFAPGANYYIDPQSPNEVEIPAEVAATFRRRTQTGEGGSAATTLDVGNYDVAGTITAIIGTKYTNQRAYLFPNGNLIIQYGQDVYTNMSNAIAAIPTEPYVVYANIEGNAAFIGVISVRSTATDLSDDAQAIFTRVDAATGFPSGSSGTSTTTLGQAYDNSSNPEIPLTAATGPVTLRAYSGGDATNALEVQNNAGTTNFAVKGDGTVTTTNSINIGTGGTLNMGNLIGTRLNIYSTTYKIGIAGATMWYDVPTTAVHEFRVNAVPYATVSASGLDVVGNITASGDGRVEGTMYVGATADANAKLIIEGTSSNNLEIYTVGTSQNVIDSQVNMYLNIDANNNQTTQVWQVGQDGVGSAASPIIRATEGATSGTNSTVKFYSTTDATSSTVAGVIFDGGIAIAKAINVGTTGTFGGTVTAASPTLSTHLTTKGYVDGLVQGLDWQDSVLDKDLTTSPVSPTTGDRYIIAGIGGDWSTGTINDIAEYNGATWDFETPNEGFAVWVEDENKLYVFNSTSWVTFGSTVDHGNLIGLSDDDHTQYFNQTRLGDGTVTSIQVDNININGNTIISTDTNGNINLHPNATGLVNLHDGAATLAFDGLLSSSTLYIQGRFGTETVPTYSFSTDTDTGVYLPATGQLGFAAGGVLRGYFSSAGLTVNNLNLLTNTLSSTNANGDINLSPNGTGTVVINTDLDVDNVNINGNTIITTNTNGDLTLTPNGTGKVIVSSDLNVAGLVSNNSTEFIGYATGTLGSTDSTVSVSVSGYKNYKCRVRLESTGTNDTVYIRAILNGVLTTTTYTTMSKVSNVDRRDTGTSGVNLVYILTDTTLGRSGSIEFTVDEPSGSGTEFGIRCKDGFGIDETTAGNTQKGGYWDDGSTTAATSIGIKGYDAFLSNTTIAADSVIVHLWVWGENLDTNPGF